PVLTCLLITLACSGGKRQKNTLSFVSFDEELRLGEQLASQARVILPLVRNQEILTFLDSLACELGRVSDWDGLAYRVYLVNKPDYNHFSLPGGHIFLFRGLLERCRSIDQIAVVIAHEIAHVAHRHSVGRLSEKYAFSFAAQSVIGENPEIAAEIINSLYAEGTILDYPEEWEHLADEKALEYTWKADYNPAGLVQVLEHGIDLQLNNPENVELLNRTHPSASSRLKRVRMHLALIPAKANLRTESAEFDRIQEVLKKIR
ncbi:M48 family metalloprotease, partial [candidate division KSB1 bacterium]|nr:M48 family metalloprotease [candidate division KSB1 bacterium]